METQIIYLNQKISNLTSELSLVTQIRDNILNGYKDQLASLVPLQVERDTLLTEKEALIADKVALTEEVNILRNDTNPVEIIKP